MVDRSNLFCMFIWQAAILNKRGENDIQENKELRIQLSSKFLSSVEHKRTGGRKGLHKEDLGTGPKIANDNKGNVVSSVYDK